MSAQSRDTAAMIYWETVELQPLPDDGFVVEVSGDITYRRENVQGRITSGMVIRPGCYISMQAGSHLAIRTSDGAVHRLEPEGEQARDIHFVHGNPATFVDDCIRSAREHLAAGLSGLEAAAHHWGPEIESWLKATVRSISADEARRLFDPAAATALTPATSLFGM